MAKIIDAVSLILTVKDKVYAIKRQNYLKAFPGYTAFPGGKVEASDAENETPNHDLFKSFPTNFINALCREAEEELSIDLNEWCEEGRIKAVHHLGTAVTPDFNPLRFSTWFFKLELGSEVPLIADENEAATASWVRWEELSKEYEQGNSLAVPPIVKLIKTMAADPLTKKIDALDFSYDAEKVVPCIESLKGIRQYMPMSLTLPPANRTNCFVIGDKGGNVLMVDPSPKDVKELDKLLFSVKDEEITHIFLTHHHSDHVAFAPDIAKKLKLPILVSQDSYQRLIKKNGPDFFKGVEIDLVTEGKVVTNWLGSAVSIYTVPGHDEGQLALMPENKKWFLAGDLFQGIGTVVVGDDEGDMGKYFSSLKKVIKLKPNCVMPSHGIILGGVDILEKTYAHRLKREEQILELALQNKNENEILSLLYFDVDIRLHPYALKNIESHLKKLRLEGKLKI